MQEPLPGDGSHPEDVIASDLSPEIQGTDYDTALPLHSMPNSRPESESARIPEGLPSPTTFRLLNQALLGGLKATRAGPDQPKFSENGITKPTTSASQRRRKRQYAKPSLSEQLEGTHTRSDQPPQVGEVAASQQDHSGHIAQMIREDVGAHNDGPESVLQMRQRRVRQRKDIPKIGLPNSQLAPRFTAASMSGENEILADAEDDVFAEDEDDIFIPDEDKASELDENKTFNQGENGIAETEQDDNQAAVHVDQGPKPDDVKNSHRANRLRALDIQAREVHLAKVNARRERAERQMMAFFMSTHRPGAGEF